jgi:V8-like Glu-specific endopeptidase
MNPIMQKKKKRRRGSVTNAPITFDEWPNVIHEVKAKRAKRKFELPIASALTATNLAKSGRLSRSKGRIEILLRTNQVGQRFFPPPVKTVALDEKRVRARKLDEKRLSGFRPDHLAMRPLPKPLPKELHVAPSWVRPEGQEDDLGQPGTIFAPDTRSVFSDTSSPWCTCGRVEVAGDWGSGVMVGPRHMMTASHVIRWGPNNTAGWVKFTPLQFDTSEPFGFANVITIYSYQQFDHVGVTSNEAAFDYVVCVLDRRLGEIIGWMGSEVYSPDWNGGSYWAHVGYPNDMGGGKRPIFHGNGIMDSTISETAPRGGNSFRIMHKNDYMGGQSGGPAFGWFGNEEWPRVVAIYSSMEWGKKGGPNANAGGSALPYLINHARAMQP